MAEIDDGIPSCRFYVAFGGGPEAVFTEVSGLAMELAVEDVEEGGNNHFVHRTSRTLQGEQHHLEARDDQVERVHELDLRHGEGNDHEKERDRVAPQGGQECRDSVELRQRVSGQVERPSVQG